MHNVTTKSDKGF